MLVIWKSSRLEINEKKREIYPLAVFPPTAEAADQEYQRANKNKVDASEMVRASHIGNHANYANQKPYKLNYFPNFARCLGGDCFPGPGLNAHIRAERRRHHGVTAMRACRRFIADLALAFRAVN
jgi:hypothetical protein